MRQRQLSYIPVHSDIQLALGDIDGRILFDAI